MTVALSKLSVSQLHTDNQKLSVLNSIRDARVFQSQFQSKLVNKFALTGFFGYDQPDFDPETKAYKQGEYKGIRARYQQQMQTIRLQLVTENDIYLRYQQKVARDQKYLYNGIMKNKLNDLLDKSRIAEQQKLAQQLQSQIKIILEGFSSYSMIQLPEKLVENTEQLLMNLQPSHQRAIELQTKYPINTCQQFKQISVQQYLLENNIIFMQLDADFFTFNVKQVKEIINDFHDKSQKCANLFRLDEQLQYQQNSELSIMFREMVNLETAFQTSLTQITHKQQVMALTDLYLFIKQQLVVRLVTDQLTLESLIKHKEQFMTLIRKNQQYIEQVMSSDDNQLNYMQKILCIDLVGLQKEQIDIEKHLLQINNIQDFYSFQATYMERNLRQYITELTGVVFQEEVFDYVDEPEVKPEPERKRKQFHRFRDLTQTIDGQIDEDDESDLYEKLLQLQRNYEKPKNFFYTLPQFDESIRNYSYNRHSYAQVPNVSRNKQLELLFYYKIRHGSKRDKITQMLSKTRNEAITRIFEEYQWIGSGKEIVQEIVHLFRDYELEQVDEKLELLVYTSPSYQKYLSECVDVEVRIKNKSLSADKAQILNQSLLYQYQLQKLLKEQERTDSTHVKDIQRLQNLEFEVQRIINLCEDKHTLQKTYEMAKLLRLRIHVYLISDEQYVQTATFLKNLLLEESSRVKTLIIQLGIIKHQQTDSKREIFQKLLINEQEFQEQIIQTHTRIKSHPLKYLEMKALIQKMKSLHEDVFLQLLRISNYIDK
ncbi:Hypothetical_protein [Hexamita inflata]|uniref:Hypothetical_protein n=1 Tax=Hexamita inflata TaxID=28002 RepID=A0AA86PN43_9EUKA|nr:Hypothetical protein HINF_LOCUS30709 [Hexamita inflata]